MEVEPIGPPRPAAGEDPGASPLGEGSLGTLVQEILRVMEGGSTLEEVQEVLGLSSAETAALFGVTRQAVDGWRRNGVPATRMAEVERVRDVARVLYEELIPTRIPQVVRTPARGLGGRTILQVLAGPEGPERVRGYLARLYAFDAR
jgi:hypothetical protein